MMKGREERKEGRKEGSGRQRDQLMVMQHKHKLEEGLLTIEQP